MRRRAALILIPLSVAVGVANGLVFLGFEWVVKHGTDWIWNGLAGSDAVRWRVVPLALVLSVAYSAVLRLLREPRWTPPHLDPLGAADDPEDAELPSRPPALTALATILLVGGASLLAGASLGPEAPLVALAMALGTWAAVRADVGAPGRVLILASVGALLAAFFGSPIPIAIPLLVMWQRLGRIPPMAVVPIALAGLAALGTLLLVQGNDRGFGQVPSFGVRPRDYAAAVALGVAAVPVGRLLRRLVVRLAEVAERVQARASWWLAGAVFGAVLGALYLLGGESVQFSGAEGVGILLSREAQYGTWALAGIALVKLLVTSWSLAAGYRGGLIFPTVFAGVAISAFAGSALPDLAGPGILLGSVAGLLVEMASPVLGGVMLLALLPTKLLPLGLAGAAAAIAAGRALRPRVAVR